ncbi:intercellular adhesion molecule 1-like [Astatotilapia calliptera]|uniref:intercellular adhesion molecule 1-like n=1 Tax=Astatotilapia calliptera TaxID=8154 RepID=UPI000E4190D6|nr:intercellular adhesion molecule 1-like [Astatotilapia calliptera]
MYTSLFVPYAKLKSTSSLGNPASASCPLQISPPRVVVRLEGSFSANCTSLSDQIDGMGWESPYGGLDLTQGVTSLLFSIDSVPAWEIEAMCYMNSRDGDQCTKVLPVTVYKMPDSVSLRQNSTTVKEGEQFAIQCDIVNVAPARNLSMLWHKGNKILNSETFDDSSPSPVSKSSVLTLTAHGDDDGAEIWCEAKLNLWPGEQGPAMMRSKSHSVTVLRARTTFGVKLAIGVAIGVLLLIAVAYYVTPNGTISFHNCGYQPGTPSG